MRRWEQLVPLVVQLEMHGLTNRLEHLENADRELSGEYLVTYSMLKGLQACTV